MPRTLFALLLTASISAGVSYAQTTEPTARELYDESLNAQAQGDFSTSIELLNQIREGNYELSEYQLALVHNTLGWAYYELGQFEKAIEHYRSARIFGAGEDPSHVRVSVGILNNLGLYYNALGEYTNALELLGKAQRLLDSIPLQNADYFKKLSRLQFNSGVALFHLGQVNDALELLKSSEGIKEKYGFSHRGSVYFNLARIYRVLGEADQSRHYFLKGIDQWSAEFDTGYFQLANLYKEYGFLLAELGNTEEGMSYLDKALQSYKANYGDKHPLTASGHKTQGEIYLLQGEYQHALKSFQVALSAVSEDFKEDDFLETPAYAESTHDRTLLNILSSKALALEGAGKAEGFRGQESALLNAALATNKLSISIFQRIQNSYFTEESRLFLISQQKSLFTTGIRLNIKLFELTGFEEYREQAFLTAARGKSNEFLLEMKTKEWLYLESLSDTIALSTLELGQEVDHLSNQIGLYRQALTPDSVKIVQLQDKLLVTRDSFTRNMQQLTAWYPQLASFESIYADFNLEQIRKKLQRKETLLEYFISGGDAQGRRQLYGFAVNTKECHFYQVTIDSSFSHHVELILSKLHGFDPYTESQGDYNLLKSALFEVYRIAFQPLDSKIAGKSIIIVPDEKLAYIPFDALITRRDLTPTRNYAGLPYLLHEYDISYLHNTQLLQHNRRVKGRFPSVKAWIPGNEALGQSNMPALEGAEMEVNGILNLFKGKRIQHSPDKKKITEEFLSRDVLHLALHSLAIENEDQSPYFILGPAYDSLDSNRLHDYEINALSLTSPMVVLSSCESAGGNLQSGEGIKSLSRSFLLGGAESVVHTLWPLEDKKGKEVIIGYYEELKKGKSKSIALSMAKRQYLQSNPNATTHPYYWATFQVNGDPAPLGKRGRMLILSFMLIVLAWGSYFLIRRSFFSRD